MNWNGLIKLGIIVGENIMEKHRESIAVECPNCGFTGNRIRRASTGFCTFCGTAIRVSSEGKAYFVTQEKDTAGQDPVKAQPAPASETPEAPKEEEG